MNVGAFRRLININLFDHHLGACRIRATQTPLFNKEIANKCLTAGFRGINHLAARVGRVNE